MSLEGKRIFLEGWMSEKLNLKGNELITFALIHGFSQKESHTYHGSAQYIADWTGTSKRAVFNILKSLVEKGYIKRTEEIINNVTFVHYETMIKVVDEKLSSPVMNNDNIGSEKTSYGVVKKLPMSSEETSSNNKYINKYNNIDRKEYIDKSIYKKSSKFVKPTIDEIKEYCSQMNYKVDAEKFYLYYEQCGWTVGKNKPMKDWRASLRLWNMNQSQYQERAREQSKVASLNFSNEECEKQLKDEVIPF